MAEERLIDRAELDIEALLVFYFFACEGLQKFRGESRSSVSLPLYITGHVVSSTTCPGFMLEVSLGTMTC